MGNGIAMTFGPFSGLFLRRKSKKTSDYSSKDNWMIKEQMNI
jgi:hypothetical protein